MNWGNKLLLTYVVFASGMGYLVYRSVKTNFELVEKDYYKTELKYQEVIDATSRASKLEVSPVLEQTPEGILLQLSGTRHVQHIAEGEIWFYCPYDESKDKRIKLKTDEHGRQLFESGTLKTGAYQVKIRWKEQDLEYYSESRLVVN